MILNTYTILYLVKMITVLITTYNLFHAKFVGYNLLRAKVKVTQADCYSLTLHVS